MDQFAERLLPPQTQAYRPLMVGAAGANKWIPFEEQLLLDYQEKMEGAALIIEVKRWNSAGVFAAISYLRDVTGTVATQC